MATGEPYEVAHRTLYRIHQRVAAQYRKGRVFLAGDAAHINNPLGGMGMNGGIHDAFSLAEKLAAVLRAEAEPETLDLYERQRRPIAIEFIQAQTLQNRALLTEPDAKLRTEKLDEIRAIAADPVRAHAFPDAHVDDRQRAKVGFPELVCALARVSLPACKKETPAVGMHLLACAVCDVTELAIMAHWTFGSVEVDKVLEFEKPLLPPDVLFPASTADAVNSHRDWLEPVLMDPASGLLTLSLHSFVVRTTHHTILVDTCTGNDKPRPDKPRYHMQSWPYLENLAAIGVAPEEIDFVMCTHLHVDHVGWNTRLSTVVGCRPSPMPAISSPAPNGITGTRTRTGRGTPRTPIPRTALCPLSRPDRSSSSTWITPSTMRSGSTRRRATPPAMSASISPRAGARQ